MTEHGNTNTDWKVPILQLVATKSTLSLLHKNRAPFFALRLRWFSTLWHLLNCSSIEATVKDFISVPGWSVLSWAAVPGEDGFAGLKVSHRFIQGHYLAATSMNSALEALEMLLIYTSPQVLEFWSACSCFRVETNALGKCHSSIFWTLHQAAAYVLDLSLTKVEISSHNVSQTEIPIASEQLFRKKKKNLWWRGNNGRHWWAGQGWNKRNLRNKNVILLHIKRYSYNFKSWNADWKAVAKMMKHGIWGSDLASAIGLFADQCWPAMEQAGWQACTVSNEGFGGSGTYHGTREYLSPYPRIHINHPYGAAQTCTCYLAGVI